MRDRKRFISALELLLLAVALGLWLLAGCMARRLPDAKVSYRFIGCQVTATWTDGDGVERKQCECMNGTVIGIDAKTRQKLIRCE